MLQMQGAQNLRNERRIFLYVAMTKVDAQSRFCRDRWTFYKVVKEEKH